MSLRHVFRCEYCGKEEAARFNTEHYLPPAGWLALYCEDICAETGEHICAECWSKRKTVNKKKAKKDDT